MAHYRTFFDDRFVGSWDIEGKDATITIAAVKAEKLRKRDGDGTDTKLSISVRGSEKGFIVNKTNARIIAGLYGNDTDAWIGQQITLYATDVSAFGGVHRCIRVRDRRPAGRPAQPQQPARQREPGEEG